MSKRHVLNILVNTVVCIFLCFEYFYSITNSMHFICSLFRSLPFLLLFNHAISFKIIILGISFFITFFWETIFKNDIFWSVKMCVEAFILFHRLFSLSYYSNTQITGLRYFFVGIRNGSYCRVILLLIYYVKLLQFATFIPGVW